ncbi:hypothetical protein ACP275_12G179000 [Erythranthe tilingii]
MDSSLSNPSSCESTSVIAAAAKEKEKEKEKQRKKNKVNGGGKLSTDPQSVAARQRRHRISERFKILQSLVPGGSKMDTVSMLEEAIQYVKFLQNQIWLHHSMIDNIMTTTLNADPTNYVTVINNCSSSLLINDNDDHLHLPFAEDNNNYSSSWEDEIYGAAPRRSDHHYYS